MSKANPEPPQSSASAPTSTQKRPTRLSTSSSSPERHDKKRRDHRSSAIDTCSQQPKPLRRYTHVGLATDPWVEGGSNNVFVEPPYAIDHPLRSPLGLEINASLAGHAQGPLSSRLSGRWEQDYNNLSSHLPEQLSRQTEPANDVLEKLPQPGNDRDDQEAIEAEFLLQAICQHACMGSRFGSVTSLSRK